jgi:hypothetical protein
MSEELDVPDETLDAIVSEAHEARTRTDEEPTDDELIRYASGDLDRSRAKEIQTALLRSSALRRRTADVARVVEELSDPDTSRRFDESRVLHIPDYQDLVERGQSDAGDVERTVGRTPTTQQGSGGRRVSLLIAFLTPLLLLGYPAFRFLSSPEARGAGAVVPVTTVSLTASLQTRPVEKTMTVVQLSRDDALLEVLISVAAPSPATRYDLLIAGPGEFREEHPDWTEFTDAAEGSRLRILLDTSSLPRGMLRIEVTPRPAAGSPIADKQIYWLTVLDR